MVTNAASETESSVTSSRWVDRLASKRLWVLSTALFVPFALVFFASSAPFSIAEVREACGDSPPDLRFFTSGADVDSFLAACGPAGRSTYRNMQLADLFYPAVVGLFLASSLALVIRRLSPPVSAARWLATIPLLASTFDYLENAFAWIALRAYPDPIRTNDLLGFASAAKTTTSWIGGGLLLVGLARLGTLAGRRKVRSSKNALLRRFGTSDRRSTTA